MSYINWGSESQEQLAIRRMLEEQALYEQAVRASQSRAGNTPGAVGGGSQLQRQESLPGYCGGDKEALKYTFYNFDFLSPNLKEYIPTDESLATWDTTEEEAAEQRAWRDSYGKAQFENLLAKVFQNRELNSPYPEPPIPESDALYRLDFQVDSQISPFTFNVSGYSQWVDAGSDIEMPTVTRLNILPAVELESELTSVSGLPGDIIYAVETGLLYAWNKNISEWSSSYYTLYIETTISAIRTLVDIRFKNKFEMVLAARPFLMAALYIPKYIIKQNNL